MTDQQQATVSAFDAESLFAAVSDLFNTEDAGGLVVKVGKGDSAIEVAFATLPPASIAHAVRRGLQEDLNNAKAGLGDDPAKAAERIAAVAEKYRTADFSRATGERGPSDSVDVVMGQVAREQLATMITNAKKANSAFTLSKEDRATALKALLDQNGKAIRKEAERRIAERKSAAESAINQEGSAILKLLKIDVPAAES